MPRVVCYPCLMRVRPFPAFALAACIGILGCCAIFLGAASRWDGPVGTISTQLSWSHLYRHPLFSPKFTDPPEAYFQLRLDPQGFAFGATTQYGQQTLACVVIPLHGQMYDYERLEQVLHDAHDKFPEHQSVQLLVDDRTHHDLLVHTMDMLISAHLPNISLWDTGTAVPSKNLLVHGAPCQVGP